ncbi:CBS domain-containing protein [Paenibacillus psychroresistens]|uniref:CBS domain-containing protein n=1 Tax=Paenibacillus psychroresistens TaxID=1778678 RepID=A0A6B8RCD5_9BACL|nr:helix-turn-helix transcriptional regulator [Paenibacillus psychroresistens]QGQ93969.1 CBS domain-containing protein [Paenibacillus psychroresistens]
MEIVRIVQLHAPITGEQIAEQLGTGRPTIRSDLSVLVMLEYIDAKPKVGYFPIGKSSKNHQLNPSMVRLKVKDVQAMPVIVRETATVNDAVVTLFLENVGSLIVADAEGILQGVISRKDLLKVTLGNPSASTMPVGLIMTRRPNIVTVSPEDDVIEAARKMMHHQVDSLPVVLVHTNDKGIESSEVIGRVTKSTMTQILLNLLTDAY